MIHTIFTAIFLVCQLPTIVSTPEIPREFDGVVVEIECPCANFGNTVVVKYQSTYVCVWDITGEKIVYFKGHANPYSVTYLLPGDHVHVVRKDVVYYFTAKIIVITKRDPDLLFDYIIEEWVLDSCTNKKDYINSLDPNLLSQALLLGSPKFKQRKSVQSLISHDKRFLGIFLVLQYHSDLEIRLRSYFCLWTLLGINPNY